MRALLLGLTLLLGCTGKSNPAPGPGSVPGSSGTSGTSGSSTGGGASGSGTSGSSDSGAASGSGSAAECQPSECGPRLGLAARKCADGSLGGNTGRCLRHADGRCGWEVRACPEDKP